MNAQYFWLLGISLIPAMSALGQTKRGPFDGVWQAVQVTLGGPRALTVKPGANLTIFAGKHYSRIEVHSDKPRPVVENPASATAEELREVWGPFVAEGGTYELTDNLITMHPIVAKNPAAMGPNVSLVYSYKLEGDTLTLTAQRDRSGPVTKPFTVKLSRIE
jgi:Lipocalin-like domain